MTPEECRDLAQDFMHFRAAHTGRSDILVFVDGTDLTASDTDVEAIADLIRTANVEITWPDPCPACGALGCTEHPTWAAEAKVRNRTQPYNIEPELPEWERELLERQALADDTARDLELRDLIERVRRLAPLTVERGGLTPAQEIRLRAFETLASEGTSARTIDEVLDMVVRAGRVIETGNPDDLEDACAERCPNAEQHEPGEVERLRGQLAEAHAAAATAEGRLAKLIEAARIHVRMDGKMDPAAVLDVLGVEPWSDPYRPSALIPRPAGLPYDPSGGGGVKVTLTPVEPYVHEAVKEFAEQTGRAGYSETLRIPGTDDAVVLTSGGLERVVTAQDPGGLLSEAVPFVARSEMYGEWKRVEVDDEPATVQEPPEPSDPHSGTQEGCTGLTAAPAAPATAIPADSESGETP